MVLKEYKLIKIHTNVVPRAYGGSISPLVVHEVNDFVLSYILSAKIPYIVWINLTVCPEDDQSI